MNSECGSVFKNYFYLYTHIMPHRTAEYIKSNMVYVKNELKVPNLPDQVASLERNDQHLVPHKARGAPSMGRLGCTHPPT